MVRHEEARPRSINLAPFSFAIAISFVAFFSAACAPTHAPLRTVPEVDRSESAQRPPDGSSDSAGSLAAAESEAGATDADRPAPSAVAEAADADASDDTASVDEDVSPASRDELELSPPLASDEQVERERKLANEQATEYDIPMVVNDRVTAWVDYYCGPHHEKFAASLVRSGLYLAMVQKTFEEAGIPKDLAYMAHVESTFKPRAYSRAKAKGIFQFIPATGRRYGLHSDAWVDDRSDPEMSARAAAAYLKDLYSMFGDWYLALAAYNAGEGKVARGLASTKATDFWALAKTTKLRPETKNYVPAILAATLIAKDPAQYGFDVVPAAPLAFDAVEVRGSYDLQVLARKSGISLEDLKDLNPELRKWRTPPDRTTVLRVPVNSEESLVAVLGQIPESARIESVEHEVRSGETLGKIAGRYRVSVASIQSANKLGRSTVIHPGHVLLIPTSSDWAPSEPEVAQTRRAPRGESYKVHSGDTLSSIARAHGTTPAAIASASGIAVDATLLVGARLRLPGGSDSTSASKRAGAKVATEKDAPQTHQVRRGETLWIIASRYRTSVARLCEWNDLKSAEVLKPGRMLTIYAN